MSTVLEPAAVTPRTMVRSLFTAVRIPGAEPPYDTAHLRLYYPGVFDGDPAQVASGELPVDPAAPARLPVVVFLPGVNVNPDGYRWLAVALVEAGFAVVVPTWIGPLLPGQVGITPGVDIAAMAPATYGSRPACPLLRPVLDALAVVDAGPGHLGGRLDLDRVVVGGHSAGGSVALLSADDRWFPEVVGGFAYGAHNAASTMLGWPAGSVPPYSGRAPLLLVAGTEDGVIKASAFRYGEEGQGAARRDPVRRTFDEAIGADRDAWLVVLNGANHLLACDPHDETSARGFLEVPSEPKVEVGARAHLAQVVVAFCRFGAGLAAATDVDAWCDLSVVGVAEAEARRGHPVGAVAP